LNHIQNYKEIYQNSDFVFDFHQMQLELSKSVNDSILKWLYRWELVEVCKLLYYLLVEIT